jgi:hypothetical protein
MVDTSIGKVYVFSTSTTPSLSNLRMEIFLVIGVIYVIAQFLILEFIRNKIKEIRIKKQLYLTTLNQGVRIAQSVLSAVFVYVLIQMVVISQYDVAMLSIATGISYTLAVVILVILALRFFSWFKSNGSYVVLSYGLSSTALAINVLLTLVIVVSNLSDVPVIAYPHAAFSTPFFTPGSLSDILYNTYTISAISSFVFTWAATSLLLHHYSKKLGTAKYWIILAIPLAYFVTQFLPLFPELYSEFRQSDPILFSIIYTLIFSWSKPAGGILFAVAFWLMARSLKKSSIVRSYMIVSAYGFVLLFTSNQAIILLGVSYPPFGLAASSFVGLSSYLILVGIYSSAISVSEDSKLRQSLRSFAIRESKFLESIGTAHMEQEIQKRVLEFTKRTQDMMAEETGIQSSMTEDDMKQYLEQVIREVKIQKSSTNHNNKTSRHGE